VATEVGPRLTQATASDRFAGATSVVLAVRRAALRDLQTRSRRWLHLMNLPAGSDIRLLRREIGALERQVRDLTRLVEQVGVSSSTERQVMELGERVEELAAAAASNGASRSAKPAASGSDGRARQRRPATASNGAKRSRSSTRAASGDGAPEVV
jgi:hypothetical protein